MDPDVRGGTADVDAVTGLPHLVDVLVVGAGQAGLAVLHELRRRGVDAHAVDCASRVGDTWRRRWDSLRLFTPATANGLPGAAMPGPDRHPSKDAAAAFLESYAGDLPVHLGITVVRLERGPDGFVAEALGPDRGPTRRVRAARVVAATGAHRRPVVPGLASAIAPSTVQVTSAEYRRPDALPPGPVLVVGAGNSGAEIATDLAGAGRDVTLAGRDVGRIPQLGTPVFRAMRRIRTTSGPGRALARLATGAGGDPLGRIDPRDLLHAGVGRVGRVTGVAGGIPVTDDGPLPGHRSVVWCTGMRPDLSWLRPAVSLDGPDVPAHRAGVVCGVPGLYLLGQPFQRTMASHLLGGVGADAEALARHITGGRRATARPVRTSAASSARAARRRTG